MINIHYIKNKPFIQSFQNKQFATVYNSSLSVKCISTGYCYSLVETLYLLFAFCSLGIIQDFTSRQ